MCLVKITNTILGDENNIITVSTYDKVNDVFIGLPAVINKRGISSRIFLDLNNEETLKLQKSIDVIRGAIDEIF